MVNEEIIRQVFHYCEKLAYDLFVDDESISLETKIPLESVKNAIHELIMREEIRAKVLAGNHYSVRLSSFKLDLGG